MSTTLVERQQQLQRPSPVLHQQASPHLSSQSSPESIRKGQQIYDAEIGGAPPNTPSSVIPNDSMSITNTPRQSQHQMSSALVTPVSRSSAAQSDGYYSGQSDRIIQQQQDSPFSEGQASINTAVPFNTPEVTRNQEMDRSKEDAGSTPGATSSSLSPQQQQEQLQQQAKRNTRIFSEPIVNSKKEGQDVKIQQRAVSALSQAPVQSTLSSLHHEESKVINRLVVADLEEDVEREKMRLAESQLSPSNVLQTNQMLNVPQNSPVNGLGLSEVQSTGGDGGQQKSRQEYLKNAQPKREVKFGDYILGQTIGEGEFGKVKLGWKRDGGAVQVAIKLIRREVLGSNPNRLPKIYREIAILQGLQHPNIVRLHEMVETERHIGIILEYASGGELFDYILNHRYLKDHAARRLFAQLVSGVGYLHKRGIVHRDLKLENLLLDRNKNIIITDFGFANTFNPKDELTHEIEYNLGNRDFVQRAGLEQIHPDGHRRGDLMQTSCGSPCYAAPELVVSDSLYTGRKVDVWSCGVILYAMLSGYLPFDDDPANPEGDNINLLYKYIVSTPLTFPEHVTPHARDLLRRILVPDPRRRADLFEVARHSWLNDYAHVVAFITSNVEEDHYAAAGLSAPPASPANIGIGRSASVREGAKKASPLLSGKSPIIGGTSNSERAKQERDAKRMTVQVEYVAPQKQTIRGEIPIQNQTKQSQTPASSSSSPRIDSTKSPRIDGPRAVSDSTAFINNNNEVPRPSTKGSTTGSVRLSSRGNSYGQPAAAALAPTNVEGRFFQPSRSSVVITGPTPIEISSKDPSTGRPMSQQFPPGYLDQYNSSQEKAKHHWPVAVEGLAGRLFGRSNSTRRPSSSQEGGPSASSQRPERRNRRYPPVSMNNAIKVEQDNTTSTSNIASPPRQSTESRRSSIIFGRKDKDNEDTSSKRASKRFSGFIPQAFSRMSLLGSSSSKDQSRPQSQQSTSQSGTIFGGSSKRNSMITSPRSRHDSKATYNSPNQTSFGNQMAFGRGTSPSPSQETSNSSIPVMYDDGEKSQQQSQHKSFPHATQPQRGATAPDLSVFNRQQQPISTLDNAQSQIQQQPSLSSPRNKTAENTSSFSPLDKSGENTSPYLNYTSSIPQTITSPDTVSSSTPQYPKLSVEPGKNLVNESNRNSVIGRQAAVLQKPQRKFVSESEGKSTASRVMKWFRNRAHRNELEG